MNRITFTRFTQLAALALALFAGISIAQAQTTSFTYQGSLTDGSSAASGPYDFQFRLYDALTGGTLIGMSPVIEDVAVTGGVFTIPNLDFGPTAFPGAARFLEIHVRPGANTGALTMLTPRQPLTSTPYAIKSLSAMTAMTADGLSAACAGCVTAGQINNINSSQINGTFTGAQLTLPLSLSGSNINPILSSTNTGAGDGIQGYSTVAGRSGGFFSNNNSTGYGAYGNSDNGTGVAGQTTTGRGVYGVANGASGANFGVYGTTASPAGVGVYGTSSVGVAMKAESSAGDAIQAFSTAANRSGGFFSNNNSSGFGVYGNSDNGTGVAGQTTGGRAIYGLSNGAGVAIKGESTGGDGIQGFATAAGRSGGFFSNNNSAGFGLFGNSDNGTGVVGLHNSAAGTAPGVLGSTLSLTGTGVLARGAGATGTALQIESGAIRVPNAGIGSSTTVFIHRATAANIFDHTTEINHPMTNGSPTAILIVTPNFNPGGAGGTANDHPTAVYYDNTTARWRIFNLGGAAMTVNAAFNVLIVKP